MKKINLTKKELEAIISSLLFMCSTDVIINEFDNSYQNYLFELAKRLNDNLLPNKIKNIKVYGNKSTYDNKELALNIKKLLKDKL